MVKSTINKNLALQLKQEMERRFVQAIEQGIIKLKEEMSLSETRSLEGSVPSFDTGELAGSLGYAYVDGTWRIGVNPYNDEVGYAWFLEYGTIDRYTKDGVFRGKLLPRPFMDKLMVYIEEEFNNVV